MSIQQASVSRLDWVMSVQCLLPAMSTQLPHANGWVYRPCRGYPRGGMGVERRSSQLLIPMHAKASKNC